MHLHHPHLPAMLAALAAVLAATGVAVRGGVFPEHGRHLVVGAVIVGLLAAALFVIRVH